MPKPKAGPFKALAFEPLVGVSLPGGRGKGPHAGKGGRFYTEKAILGRIARNVGGHTQVMVKVTSWGHSASRARGHLDYITRNGRVPAENEQGQAFDEAGTVRDALRGWFLEHDPKPYARKTLHMVLSMPAGTDPSKVLEGARRFAREEFGDRQYFMVLHSTDTDPRQEHPKHPHVHLQVKSLNDAGERLRIGPADLRRFREVFAERMREQGVEANASGAFERGQVERRPRTRAMYEFEREPDRSYVMRARAEQADLRRNSTLAPSDMTLPGYNIGRLLKLAKEDYLLVIKRLSRSQRAEDLKFAEAATAWIDKFPVLNIRHELMDERAQTLRDSLSINQAGNRNHSTDERTR